MITEPLKEFLGPTKYAEYLKRGNTHKPMHAALELSKLTNEELIVLFIMREIDHEEEVYDLTHK